MDFHKIEEANKYGLTVAEKTKIDTMSMADLKAKYSSVIGNYNTYIGTGYFNPLANGENRAVIERYKILKAEEEAKIAAKAAEMNKYHYLNLYKTIAETGLRPNGTPATDLEKKIVPFVPLIPIVQAGAAAFAGYQYSKYSSSVPTGNGAKWGTENRKNSNPVDIGEVYGPQPANDPLAPLTVYGPQQHNDLLMPISTLDKLSPRQIANMSFDNIRKALPKGWELKSNNGFVHIYDDVSPNPIIRIDPPDSKTQYPHMHFYDRNKNSLDINGKIVDYRSPDAHVPWNNGQ
ncbi:hypothetical protein [Streptococcus ruminantium]|uniref:hypothetical protein n=1 Tax=Streptococcus ruminantium TaxID=1917441 RepID=UPI001D135D61|nr:hypothetical protein [Streptococcus ruminantium]